MNIQRDYKNSPIGVIPEEWEVKKIKDIGKISSGTTPLRAENKYYSNGSIHWVKTTDLNNSRILKTEEKVSEIAIKETSLKIYPENTVLVAMYGGYNQIGRTGLLAIKAAVNQALTAISTENVYPFFLLEWLNLNVGLWKNFAGSSRKDPNITSKDVGDFPIALPPLPEQRRIAALLSTWDKGIDTLSALLTQLQNRKKYLAQQLLSGKKRLEGFEGKWKIYSYNEILSIVKRPVEWNDNELYNLISIRRRSGGIFLREALYGNQIMVKDLRIVKENDFLFSKMQIVHGASALVTKEFENAKISGSYISVTNKNNRILNMNYLNWYSKIPYFYHQTYISSYGVHIEKMTFDFNSFLELSIKLPSFEEQTAIAQVLDTAEREIQLVKQQLEALKTQKKGLMQVLLTGKKRLITD